jgi:hypothetical protein
MDRKTKRCRLVESTKVSAATDKHTVIEELLEVMISIRFFPKLKREDT